MEKLLNISEAASLLNVKPRTIYELTSERGRQRGFPVIWINSKCLRFKREDIEAWVAKIAQEQR